MTIVHISIATDFSPTPAGRYPGDGKENAVAFRTGHLLPHLQKGRCIRINFDGIAGASSTWLDEAFGGLIREDGFTLPFLRNHLCLTTTDDALLPVLQMANVFMSEAEEGRLALWLADVTFPCIQFVVETDEGHPYLQIHSHGDAAWKGRKWLLSYHMTRSEVVQTALKAVLTAQEHEVREGFRYKGLPVYSPHIDVNHLYGLAKMEAFDYRPAQ